MVWLSHHLSIWSDSLIMSTIIIIIYTKDSYLYLLHKVIYMSSLTPQYFYRGKISPDYLPQCARKNRKMKSFATEIPQGEDDFISKRKRQFSVLHNQSQIKDHHLFQLSNKKQYEHSNLDVHDIEGASPNSKNLSQALKNTIKGINNKNAYEKILRDNERLNDDPYIKMKTVNGQELSSKQKYALLKKNNERKQKLPNYHYLVKAHKKTEPNTIESSPYKGQSLDKLGNDEVRPTFKFSDNLPKNTLNNANNPMKYYSKCHDDTNPSQQVKTIQYEKEVDQYHPIPSKQSIPNGKNNAKSLVELKNMWHGVNKTRMIPYKQIRKYSPTYLSVLAPPPALHTPANPEEQPFLLPKIS